MALVNPVTLEKGLRADFMKAYNNGEDPQDVIPMILKTSSSSNSEKYGWLGQAPQMVEWKDERRLKGLRDFSYTLENKDYESTIEVARNTIEDDQMGSTRVRIQDLARIARAHPRKLFFDALNAGETELAYDGQAFFSASHSEGDSGTQSNLNSSGSGTTVAQIKTDLDAAIAVMRNYLDDRGEIFYDGERDWYILAPPALEGNMRELLNASIISNTTNTYKGIAKLITSGRLTDANDWYLFDASAGVKPFIWQERRGPMFASQEANSSNGFMRKNYYYGIDVRRAFGYGLWQKAYKIKNS